VAERFDIVAKLMASRHLVAGSGLFKDFADLPGDTDGMPVISAPPVIGTPVVFPIKRARAEFI
jgi:hypothetical protein